jgi:coatomer subunit beta
VVILNDVHVDIMDYIKPAQCTETQFRTMWTEFEWENKVNINSKAKTLREFLKQLMACTNMSCLTPEASMKGDCQLVSGVPSSGVPFFGATKADSVQVRTPLPI